MINLKNEKIMISIIILSIIIIALIGVIIFGVMKGGTFSFLEKTTTLYNEEFSDITSISVNVKSYDVKIKETNKDSIEVEITGSSKNKDKIKVEQTENSLEINQEESIICIGLCLYDEAITIYVPADYNIEYDHTSSSGSLEVEGVLTTGNIKTTSGDITLKGLENGEVNSTSGNIKIDNAQELNVNSTSGDIIVGKVNDITLSATSGDVEIEEITNKISGNTTSGEIKINKLAIKEDSNLEARSGDINIGLENKVFIDAKTNSGDIDIDNSNTNPILTITTTSGDITAK